VLLKLLQVLLLLSELLLQLQQLFLLALADGVILVGLLALGEGITSVSLSLAHWPFFRTVSGELQAQALALHMWKRWQENLMR
jgi:hypothetical protein